MMRGLLLAGNTGSIRTAAEDTRSQTSPAATINQDSAARTLRSWPRASGHGHLRLWADKSAGDNRNRREEEAMVIILDAEIAAEHPVALPAHDTDDRTVILVITEPETRTARTR